MINYDGIESEYFDIGTYVIIIKSADSVRTWGAFGIWKRGLDTCMFNTCLRIHVHAHFPIIQ